MYTQQTVGQPWAYMKCRTQKIKHSAYFKTGNALHTFVPNARRLRILLTFLSPLPRMSSLSFWSGLGVINKRNSCDGVSL